MSIVVVLSGAKFAISWGVRIPDVFGRKANFLLRQDTLYKVEVAKMLKRSRYNQRN
jgi:hypothetical protein